MSLFSFAFLGKPGAKDGKKNNPFGDNDNANTFLFASKSVTESHPGKLCGLTQSSTPASPSTP